MNLREFRYGIEKVHPDSIYHHFWGRLLHPSFDEPEFNNDFAAWARHGLHEKALAERLSVVDPSDHTDIEGLRAEIIEIVEERLDESEYVPWAGSDQQFYFLRSKLIVLDTGMVVETIEGLCQALKKVPIGGVYYHLIDARRRTENRSDDFTDWLRGMGDEANWLINQIIAIDPFFSCLETIRNRLVSLLDKCEMADGEEL